VHPRFAEDFDWDEGNEAELARHGVTQAEAEEAFLNTPVWYRNKKGRSGAWKYTGRTDAGRPITIVATWRESARRLRVITWWSATRGERTRYL
jgi:uncharacterized DUF497 family protein